MTGLVGASYFVTFEVAGHPEPAGSKRIGRAGGPQGRPIILDANRKADGWKKVVASTARGAMLAKRQPVFTGPVFVEMVFQRTRPQSHLKKDGTLTAEGLRHEYPASKPDVLKLARSVEDALTGVVYDDDAKIVSERLRKEWRQQEGVRVTVMPL